MTTKEKEDLVDLLNAHSNRLIAAINNGGQMPVWMRENHERAIKACEQEFLTEPEEVT